MKLRRKEELELGIDMTPMIDCVFLLLIFFMCAATMSKVDLTPEVQLPVAPKAAVPEDLRGRGVVNILPVGSDMPAGQPVTEARPFLVYNELLDDAGLQRAISQRRAQDPDLRVYMRIDKNADFALVRRAIKACAGAGVFDIIFGTFQSNPGGGS
jgi:biopolymer transport protein ExbD